MHQLPNVCFSPARCKVGHICSQKEMAAWHTSANERWAGTLRDNIIQALVAHACNPSFSGGRDKDCSSKPAQANSSRGPISKNTLHRKVLVKGSRCRPWVQPQYRKKKRERERERQHDLCFFCSLYVEIYSKMNPDTYNEHRSLHI
jgi:hypothetical protein